MIKGPFGVAVALASSLFLVTARSAVAAHFSQPLAAHAVRVDDDDEGDDDGWFPLWFGFHAFAPRRRVIIERNYYPPPPPPPQQPVYYYYCRDPQGYYPRVPDCPSGWLRVLPSHDGPDGPP